MPYNYGFMFEFEEKFDDVSAYAFFQNHWQWSIYISIAYVAIIYLGQLWMSKRAEYDLRTLLVAWNGLLAVFSLAGTIRFAPHFIYTLWNKGFIHSVCQTDYQKQVTGFWAMAFGISKVLELGDTAFIVLRKRKLIFLHWYHHVTVFIYTWHAIRSYAAVGRWFILMNYTVHSIMYAYYALCACRFRFPKWLRMTITSLQMSQMFVGTTVSLAVYHQMAMGHHCDQQLSNCYLALLMYCSYFVLFFHFFYYTYIAAPPAPRAKSDKVAADNNQTDKNCGVKATMMNGDVANGVMHGVANGKKRQ